MTFQIGDRVKVVSQANGGGLALGEIHTVSATESTGGGYVGLDGSDQPGWRADRFELYAKAGEFVVGDRVIWTWPESGHTFSPGDMLTIAKPKYDAGPDTLWGGAGPWWFHKGYVRLATPEEIAAAQDKIVADYTDPKSFDKPLRPIAETVMARGTNGQDYAVSHSRERAEIPAAEFDFSTIKAGDEIDVRFVVDKTSDSGVVCLLGDMPFHIALHHIHAVIPAPKPKTLRERAIEAGWKAFNTSKVDDGPEAAVRDLVDAVLAEVEKGR